jgi:hypothetical protein
MNLSTVPRGRVLHKIPKEGQPPGLRRMASTSTNPPKRMFFVTVNFAPLQFQLHLQETCLN